MFTKLKKWTVKPSFGNHLDALDGLRGIAILLVVICHTFYTNPDQGLIARILGHTFWTGRIGVPIFFVLSGFLISYSFFVKRAKDACFWHPKGYFRRRFGKIIPPFYLSIAIFLIFFWLRFHDFYYFKSAWQWAIGLGNFVVPSPDMNTPYWSLIVESHFYVLIPILFWLTRGFSTRNTGIVLFLTLLLVPLIGRYWTWPNGLLAYPDSSDPLAAHMRMLESRFPNSLDYFAWGVGFAAFYAAIGDRLNKFRRFSLLGYVGVACLITTIVLLAFWSVKYDTLNHPARWSIEAYHWLAGVSAFFLLFFVFDSNCLGARMLSMKWLRFVGIVSFEWFLFHPPIVSWFSEMFGKTHGSIFLYFTKTFFPLLLTFGFSVLVYRWFSLPVLNRIRGSVKKPDFENKPD